MAIGLRINLTLFFAAKCKSLCHECGYITYGDTKMRLNLPAITAVCVILSACGGPKETAPKAALPEQSAQAIVYMQIRNLTAEGNLAAASKLTDDPAAYVLRMETARARMDEAVFNNGLVRAALPKNIEAVRDAGRFSMLVTRYEQQGTLERAPTFFRQSPEGYREIVEPDETIPCKLVRDFYAIKGDKNPEIKNCTEDKPKG